MKNKQLSRNSADNNPAAEIPKKRNCFLRLLVILTTVIFLIILPVITVFIYKSRFDLRFETDPLCAFHVEDFENLTVETCTFTSNRGQKLTGYKYQKHDQEENSVPQGVLVIAHGFGGGGHNLYMDVADYFASHNYLVFCYDATGNDASEGEGVGGLPQGIIDLDHAISYVKTQEEYQNLPIILFGHSWGAYSAGNVLNFHPDIKAAVMVAGFNKSSDMIELNGKEYAGEAGSILMPYVNLYEFLKYGKYSLCSAVDGIENSDADIMILHSSNDTTVPSTCGYDIFYEKFQNDSRVTFRWFEDRGHSKIYYTKESNQYMRILDQELMNEILQFYEKTIE